MNISSVDAEAVFGAFPYSFAYLPGGGRRAFCACENLLFGRRSIEVSDPGGIQCVIFAGTYKTGPASSRSR
jgi:hypothetical protein